MNEARPYASLSSGLLARKGTAKPAMRPQSFTSFEDLGWNDMGHGLPAEPEDVPEHVPSSIAALTPAPRAGRSDEIAEASNDEPSVVAQQRAIAGGLGAAFDRDEEVGEADAEAAVSEPNPARPQGEVVSLPKRPRSVPGKKAAFTLRLDPERHLRLRLACAVTGRSAQQIVTEAVDEMLAGLPELDALATRVPANGAKRN